MQAEYDAMAEQIAYDNGRVVAFSQYLLEDDPIGGAPGASVNGGTVGFQTGLEYANGRPKPLYSAWPLPLVVSKRRHGYSLWGLVRPAGKATTVTVLVRRKGSSSYRTLRTVHTNSAGYWTLSSSTSGHPLARALGEPRRRALRRSADPRPLAASARSSTLPQTPAGRRGLHA